MTYRILLFAIFIPTAGANESDLLTLARDSETEYQIVVCENASGADVYAVETLGRYLHEASGAEFSIVTAAQRDAEKPAIFVGLSQPMDERFLSSTP